MFEPMNISQKCRPPMHRIVFHAEHLLEPVIPTSKQGRTRRRVRAHSGSARPRNMCRAVHGRSPALASTTPVTPPTVKRKINPIAHCIGTLNVNRSPPHCRNPGEYLHARRHRDHHGCGNEVGLQINVHADRVHVVRPHDEADHTDCDHGVDHAEIAKDRLFREGRDDVADDPKGLAGS